MQATGMKCHPVQMDVRKVRKHYIVIICSHTQLTELHVPHWLVYNVNNNAEIRCIRMHI